MHRRSGPVLPGAAATLCCIVLLAGAGCTGSISKYIVKPKSFPLKATARGNAVTGSAEIIADELADNLRGFSRESDSLVVLTFSDVHHLQSTADFGRTLTDCMMSALQQRNFKIVELRKAKQLHIEKGNGEYMLSRDLTEISSRIKCKAGLVGTYSIAFDKIIVNTRIVDMADGSVMSSSSLEIALDRNIKHLLADAAGSTEAFTPGVSVFERRFSD